MSGVSFSTPVTADQVATLQTSLAGKADQSALTAVANAMPAPATGAPPAVAVDSMKGTDARYALADHTHQSRLQARRIQLTLNASGQADYTFPLAYDPGVVPIVEVTVETPTGAAYKLDGFIVQGSTTNLKTTIGVTKLNQNVVVGLLNAILPVFSAATGTVWVNIMSRAPS